MIRFMKWCTVLLVIMVFLPGCRTLRFERPPESYLSVRPAPALSDINLPIEISDTALVRLVNMRLPGEIYADTSFENNDRDNMTLSAVKTGDISIQMKGNQFFYRVPLHLVIKKRFFIGVAAFSYTDIRTATADIALKFRTRIALNADWSLAVNTFSDGYEWLSTPTLRFGILDIPVTFLADFIVKNNQKTLNAAIDQSLRTTLDPGPMVRKVWKDIQQPIRIPGEYPLWVHVTPVQVATLPLLAKNGFMQQMIGIRAVIEANYGDEPSFIQVEKPPPLKIVSRLENNFNICLAAEIPFPKLDELANAQLRGMTFEQGRKKVQITNVTLFGSDGNLVLSISLTGSINGQVYLVGNLYYDKPAGSLRIGNLDFDVKTRNVLVHSATWLFHKKIAAAFEERLVFPLRSQLEPIRRDMSAWMAADRQLDNFRFNGSVESFDLDRVDITRESVKGYFNLKGMLKFRMVAGQ
jgi:hypothetical protein